MDRWINSIYSDGTKGFVSACTPSIGEKVKISLRLLEGAPAEKIFLRRRSNGAEQYIDMKLTKVLAGLA